MVLMAVLNLCAAATYAYNGNPKLGAVTVCYAASSAIFATIR